MSKTVTDNQLASTAINQPVGVAVDTDHGDSTEESESVPVPDLGVVGVMSPVAVSTPAPAPAPAAAAVRNASTSEKTAVTTINLEDIPVQDISTLEEGEYDAILEEGSQVGVRAKAKFVSYTNMLKNMFSKPGTGNDNMRGKSTQVNPFAASTPDKFSLVNPFGTSTTDVSEQTGNSTDKDNGKAAAKMHKSGRKKSSNQHKPRFNEFIVKNSKLVTEEETEGQDIPFSALRESYKYRAHVTNLSPDCDIDAVASHIRTKLGVNANIKIVSRQGSSALSLMVMFSSASDTLDLRMSGLWPKGTLVSKWNPSFHKRKQVRQGQSYQSSARQNADRPLSPRSQNSSDNYEYQRSDQRRLNGQWRNK